MPKSQKGQFMVPIKILECFILPIMSTVKLLAQYKQNLLKNSEIPQEGELLKFDWSKNRPGSWAPGSFSPVPN